MPRPVVHVSLVLAALWIPSVAHADDPVAQEVTAGPATGRATSALASSEGAPVVELSADDERATIERRASTTSPTVPLLETGVLSMGHWEHACVSPCEMRLDPRYAYRIAGDGLVPSDSFTLPRGQDRVRVDARMGSSTGRVVGVLAMAGGVLAVAGGGLALAATPILESEDVGSQGFRTAVLAGGIGAVSVGAVSAAVGLFLWLTNGSSVHAL